MSNRERGPRFEAAFAELVQGLGSESDDEAVAAMLLELNSFPVFPPNDDAFYETVIPQPLLERPLEPSEEELLVTELHRLVRSSIHGEVHLPKTPGLIYALGNANPWVGGPRILDILVRHTDELELPDLHQAVHSLERCLSCVEADHSRYPDIAESVRRTNPTSTLERLAASELETDFLSECLPSDLRFALELVGHYLGRGSAQASPHHTP
jgi:hypothetical protein